jgi:hypothetical protein
VARELIIVCLIVIEYLLEVAPPVAMVIISVTTLETLQFRLICCLSLPLRIGFADEIQVLLVQNSFLLLTFSASTLLLFFASPLALIGLLILVIIYDKAFTNL